MDPTPEQKPDRATATLMLGALGVVFGDIGTSPIYALRECLKAAGNSSPPVVLGILSLIMWSIVVVVLLKYTWVVLRADNGGEGGIFALTALATSRLHGSTRRRLFLVGLVGAAMFYGDSMVTPAVSVLSAVEGLHQVNPHFAHWVLPISVMILCGLFAIQRRGTGAVGHLFGPVMAVWFLALAAMGAWRISQHAEVLQALSPLPALRLVTVHPALSFSIAGGSILALTGAEALYADIGHFGRAAIRRIWIALVLPCIVLGYLGEGATVLADAGTRSDPYFSSAPHWAILPMVIIAILATIIASQAVISGAFSLTRQGLEMGVLPRFGIVQTSRKEQGQIYIPLVNWVLFVAVVFLALAFRSSDALTGAYGLAVSATMLSTSILMVAVARTRWGWSVAATAAVFVPLLCVDSLYTAATLPKITEGGWFPIGIGVAMLVLMTTWSRVRDTSVEKLRSDGDALHELLDRMYAGGDEQEPVRVRGTAVYPGTVKGVAPTSLIHNLDFNHVMHDTCIFISAIVESAPRVDNEERLEISRLGHGCWQVTVRHGFKERALVPRLLEMLEGRLGDWRNEPDATTFFLPRDTFDHACFHGRIAKWRLALYTFLSRHVEDSAEYYHLPPRRVVELGAQMNP